MSLEDDDEIEVMLVVSKDKDEFRITVKAPKALETEEVKSIIIDFVNNLEEYQEEISQESSFALH